MFIFSQVQLKVNYFCLVLRLFTPDKRVGQLKSSPEPEDQLDSRALCGQLEGQIEEERQRGKLYKLQFQWQPKYSYDSPTSFSVLPGGLLLLGVYLLLYLGLLVELVEVVDDDGDGQRDAQHAADGTRWNKSRLLNFMKSIFQ